ncbi:type II secretion system F family protein [Luteococcus sp. H138]|uniref:type II secretion system F family protein n=1 Tax=unclassified Luteococcus TaxID=2639923 RepID=UPI00313C14AB
MTTSNLVAAGCVGLVCWLLLDAPVKRLGRRRGSRALPGWLQGRSDGLPLRLRGLVGILLGCVAMLGVPGLLGIALAPVVALAGVAALGRLEPGEQRRRRTAVGAELPETLDLLAATLEAGAPLRTAVAEVADIGPPTAADTLAAIRSRVSIGLSDGDAWRSLIDDPAWSAVAKDLARSSDTGSAAAAVLRQHATDARTARQDAQLAQARAVGVRSVLPLMACFLPAFLLTGVVPIVAGLVGSLTLR